MKINLFMYKYPAFQFRDMGKVTSNHVIIIPYDNQVCQKMCCIPVFIPMSDSDLDF
jgi:hypothetical protein